ncbi:hypothetical protein A7A08_02077 [Methyloligella halotolerans]|uniref:Uncharacterized protein n=1 Tax=Methyloligella halotolerans TaxID=1177755 RepID=A0A1E2RXC0_9HYPH|nr:hypothetical protein [Methyloligella halotolerans]ODA66780.1 hypothetical protein A7A08_02077 [Methyloligella halotolerans]
MGRIVALALCALIFSIPVAKACAPGCENFKWSLAETQKRLKADDLPVARSGGTLEGGEAAAFVLALVAEDDVDFARPPERGRDKEDASIKGGVVRFTPARGGTYQVSLSGAAWIDLVQNGALVPSTDHTGSADCPGLRKSVRFSLEAAPVTLQVSASEMAQIRIAIEKVD